MLAEGPKQIERIEKPGISEYALSPLFGFLVIPILWQLLPQYEKHHN